MKSTLQSTRGPSWGHPMVVLGTTRSFLEPFGGHLSPKIDKVSEELTLRYPLEGPCVVQHRQLLALFDFFASLQLRRETSVIRMAFPYSPHNRYDMYAHGGVRPFHEKSTCTTQLTSRPYVVQIWSRNTPNFGPNETRVAYRASGRPRRS